MGQISHVYTRGVGRYPWEEYQYFLEQRNQTNTCIPKTTPELVTPVQVFPHLAPNFMIVYITASSSHICFIVLFLSVLTGHCKFSLLVLVLQY